MLRLWGEEQTVDSMCPPCDAALLVAQRRSTSPPIGQLYDEISGLRRGAPVSVPTVFISAFADQSQGPIRSGDQQTGHDCDWLLTVPKSPEFHQSAKQTGMCPQPAERPVSRESSDVGLRREALPVPNKPQG
ncbi:hypothetical protein AAFF_G00353190 [Aldrovandia affinis]|uniref:Uncharacterized protein n=1 Tax=Aldrovandia affinis TaxID=143900 RepID=A0AAD7VZL0_9TELE|nr:hypothetical protein AAFF_G00353190 [Aldrovandia affinis]